MSQIPVPADIYFQDFSFDLEEFTVKRGSVIVGSYKGLTNSDRTGKYVSFPISADIRIGDLLCSSCNNHSVKSIDYGTYNGNRELINAYY